VGAVAAAAEALHGRAAALVELDVAEHRALVSSTGLAPVFRTISAVAMFSGYSVTTYEISSFPLFLRFPFLFI
jgi:hypothetical protein